MKTYKFPILIVITTFFWVAIILLKNYFDLFQENQELFTSILLLGYTVHTAILTYIFIKNKK